MDTLLALGRSKRKFTLLQVNSFHEGDIEIAKYLIDHVLLDHIEGDRTREILGESL